MGRPSLLAILTPQGVEESRAMVGGGAGWGKGSCLKLIAPVV